MKKRMPANGGNTLRMRRYNPLQTAMVPLGNSGIEKVVPDKSSLIDLETEVAIS